MKTIKINDYEYKVKYTIRALFIFEQITNKQFRIENLLDNYLFFYSIILANNPDHLLDWDEFLDALDNDPKLYTKINDVVEEEQKKNDLFDKKEEGEKKGKKV